MTRDTTEPRDLTLLDTEPSNETRRDFWLRALNEGLLVSRGTAYAYAETKYRNRWGSKPRRYVRRAA
jgi:hypothetical protein